MNFKNWKPIAGACAIFIFGMASGGVVTAGVIQNKVKKAFLGGPKAVSEKILKRLDHKLDLDSTQREQARAIILDGQKQAAVIRREIHPRIETILTASETQLRAILKPEQQAVFDKLVAERKLMFARFEK